MTRTVRVTATRRAKAVAARDREEEGVTMREGGVKIEEETTEVETTSGETTEGETTDGEMTEGEMTEGEAEGD